MRKFIVVCFTQKEFPQEFPDQDWPFHVTLLNSFQTHLEPSALGNRLGQACALHAPVEVSGKSRELFGPHNNVPVTEVTCTEELVALRDEVTRGFGTLVTYAPRPYPTYRPHVTDQRGEHLPVGGKVTLTSASLIEKVGDQRVVRWSVPLREQRI